MNVAAVVVFFVVVLCDVLTERRWDNDLPTEKIRTKVTTERPKVKENVVLEYMETFRPKSLNFSAKKSKENDREDSRTTPKSVDSTKRTQLVSEKYENESTERIFVEDISNSTERDLGRSQTTPISVESTESSQDVFSATTQDFETTSVSVSSTEKTQFLRNKYEKSDSAPSEKRLAEETLASTEETSEQSSSTIFAEDVESIPCPETPPEINVSIVNITDFDVTFEWDPLENDTCVENYVIYRDGIAIDQTNETMYTITKLNACTQYSVGVGVAFDTVNGTFNPTNFTTEQPQFFNYSVQLLEITEDTERNLNVTWQGPVEEVLQCVTNYSLVWWLEDNNAENTIVGADQTSITVTSTPCSTITLQVTPQMGVSQGILQTTNYTVDPRVFNPPDVASELHGSRYIKVTWKTDPDNNCKVEKIFVYCNAFDLPNSNYSWIVWKREITEDIVTQHVNNRYPMTINELSPFTNYTCLARIQNEAGNSSDYKISSITTDQEVPQPPQPVTVTDLTPKEFTIEWTEPQEIPGVLIEYRIVIDNNGPLHTPSPECLTNWTTIRNSTDPGQTTLRFDSSSPYYNFTISVVAVDGAGDSEAAVVGVVTPSTEPDPVMNLQKQDPIYSTNEIYNTTVKISFQPPCNTNGPFKNYQITYNGTRTNFSDDSTNIDTNQTTIDIINLKPERNYTFAIAVVTENFTSATSIVEFSTKPGVPVLDKEITPPMVNDTDKVFFTLSKSNFKNDNGEIVAWALILATSEINSGGGFGFRGEDEWPGVPNGTVQLTENHWNPFKDNISEITFVIGSDESCQNTSNVCNKRLKDDTRYWLLVRAFTEAAYKDSVLLYFQTNMLEGDYSLGLILGLTFGLLALIALIILLVFLWRRRRKSVVEELEKPPSTTIAAAIPAQKFAPYYDSIKENYNILKQQYSDLVTQSKEVAGPTTFATLVENRRKNRYTNILPFDETRVKLKIDEDDEISSDYINASYIRGYTGKIEYIATQGPLESTTRDFWKMVLQENVSIIVMVSQFVEQSKEKCYQYFPNNHESVTFGESLEVKCSTELHFGTYCMRTLQVRKGTEQRHVIHMQFLEWPDFGVPQGTDNMLQFCIQLREKANSEGGVITVHCSAGVGRTGTLIALDILLQTIDDHRDINIYRTVFDLRKQRINMVQTEIQYMFIHTCVKEYIEAPPILSNETSGERIYENMDVLRSSLKKNLIETELESAL